MHPAPLLTRRVLQPCATQAAVQSAQWQFGRENDLYLEGSIGQTLTCMSVINILLFVSVAAATHSCTAGRHQVGKSWEGFPCGDWTSMRCPLKWCHSLYVMIPCKCQVIHHYITTSSTQTCGQQANAPATGNASPSCCAGVHRHK